MNNVHETFEAHDALLDVVALKRICYNFSYSFELIKETKAEAKNPLSVFQDIDVDSQKKKDENGLFRMTKLKKKTSKKLAKSGLSVLTLKEMWKTFVTRECVHFLTGKASSYFKFPKVTRDVRELCLITEISGNK